jgi:uncharacterized membrane protein YfcA
MKSNNVLSAYLAHAAKFLPAIIFLCYGRFGPGTPDLRWNEAFLIGAVLGAVHGVWLLSRPERHSIALGVDLYLVVGGLLALASPQASRAWGEELGPAAVLVCVLVVGVLNTLCSPGGFIDRKGIDRERTLSLSMTMIGVTVAALAVSVLMRHSPLWGGVLPLAALVFVRSRLQRQAARAS